jgi:hypothetical protein
MLGARKRRAFAGGSAGNQKINARLNLTPDEPTHRVFVKRKILAERSD